jgi:hypothetical protein
MAGLMPLLFLEERAKLISPAHVVRMSLLKRIELLKRRGCIAAELCQEINNSALLGDLPFRDIHLSHSLYEFVHDGLSSHLPTSPLIRSRWWLSCTAELRGAANFSVRYAVGHVRERVREPAAAVSAGLCVQPRPGAIGLRRQ